MQVSSQTVEQEELSIDSIDGLVDFFAYAQDAFQDFKESAASGALETALCEPYVQQATAAYEEIQALVERHCKVLDLGGFLSEDDVEEMQALYNKIVAAQDELEKHSTSETITDTEVSLLEEETPEGVFVTAESVDAVEDVSDTYEDEIEEIRAITKAQGSLQITDETEVANSTVTIRHISIDSEAFRRNLSSVRGRGIVLIAKAEAMLVEYQEMSETSEAESGFAERAQLYQQLGEAVSALKRITTTITTRINAPVTEDAEYFLHSATDQVHTYEELIVQIDKGLKSFLDESEIASHPTVSAAPLSDAALPKKAANNHFEAYRPNLFSKNEMRPAIEKVATVPEYKRFLTEYFSSPGAFEAYLRRDIGIREKISKFDAVFGIVRKSPFDTLLRDMTLADLEVFDRQPSESLRQVLLDKDIQYEMYVDWMHDYEVMKQMIRTTPTMTFGELYVRAMVEVLMDEKISRTS
jgi:hypothetical protein